MKRDSSYFSLDNLDELLGIDDHLCFVDNLVKKYGKSMQSDKSESIDGAKNEFDWREVRRQLDFIQKKRNDNKFNLSIIGEFSTGKSTFINALLGKELLASSALQGTTVASTIIDYDDTYRIVLQFLDGREEQSFIFLDFSQLKTDLDHYTTNSSVARQLKTVTVYLPSDILKNNFRIIDTPGTNVTEAWHEDVTVRTLKNDSDLSIILISAEKLVTSTMLQFVERNIKDILPQCVFVITKLDLIRQRERERQVAFIKMKLEEELELERAVVLPYVSPLVLSDKESENNGTKHMDDTDYGKAYNDDVLLDISYQTEILLIQHTAKQKSLAITKKLTWLIDSIYEIISVKMEIISSEYEKKIELLNRSKKVDLSLFVKKEKQVRLEHFDNKMKDLLEDIEEEIASRAYSAKFNILSNLDDKNSLDQLKTYITSALGDDCANEAKDMIGGVDDYYERIRKEFVKEMDKYKASFSEVYQSLKIIPIDMSQSKFALPDDIEIETANITSTANYIADQLSKENKAFWGGAVAGAAIGTAVLPGIGTLVGAFVGGVLGAPDTNNTNKVREECKNKLDLQLQNYYNSISNELRSAVEEYISQISECLSEEIEEYINRYHREVDRQIALENRQRENINQQISAVNTDKTNMLNHKKQLESVMVQLNNLSRKEI